MMEKEGSKKTSRLGRLKYWMVSMGALPFTAAIPTTAFAQRGQRSFAVPGDGDAWSLSGFPVPVEVCNCSLVSSVRCNDTGSAQSSQAMASITGAVTYSSMRNAMRNGFNLIGIADSTTSPPGNQQEMR